MWTILEIIVLAAIALIAVTEFFIPLILNKPLFGSFRKNTASKPMEEKKPEERPAPLDEKISYAKEKVQEVKKVQEEVNENFQSAKNLKKESDNLFK